MARTTADLVKGVLRLGSQGGDYDDANNPSLDPFIRAANLITSRVATCADDRDLALSGEELAEIETWLSAHAYCLSDQTYASKSTGGASASFHGQTGMHLESTRYGQMALDLDFSGCLMAISKGARAGMAWGGKPASEALTWQERNG